MMYKAIAISWKDALIRFSSRSELLFFIILPIVFTAILGGGIDFSGDEDGGILLPVVDLDQSVQSAELLAQLEQSGTVRPEVMPDSAAVELTDEGEAAGILTIPSGFGSTLSPTGILNGESVDLTLQLDPASNYSLVIEQAIQTATDALTNPMVIAAGATEAAESTAPFPTEAERTEFFTNSQTAADEFLSSTPEQVRYVIAGQEVDYNYEAAEQASAGQLVTWVLIPLLATSALLAYERTSGTLRRLLVTPTRKGIFLFGTLSGQLIMSLIQMALLIGFGVLVMGVNWGQSPLALILILVSFGLAGVAMGTMLGAFVRTDSQAGNLSVLLGMVLALLGGCWWPLELFPEGVRTAVKVLPTTWAMQGLTNITLRGQGIDGVALESAVLLGFAAVFFLVGVWRFRYE